MVDFDRPLNKRGQIAGRAISRFMRETGLKPAGILCSSAARTRQTYETLSHTLDIAPVRFLQSLYESSARVILENIRQYDGADSPLMVIGHNPGLEDLTHGLIENRGQPEALQKLAEKFPTGGMAFIQIDAPNWSQIDWGRGYLQNFIRPKDLPH